MAAYAVVLLAISVAGLVLYRRVTRHAERFATVTGKAYRPRRVELGGYRYVAAAGLGLYALLAIGLPFLVLVYSSLVRIYTVPSAETLGELSLGKYALLLEDELTRTAIFNSLKLGIPSPTMVVALRTVINWLTFRSRTPGSALLDFLTFVPIPIPR